MKERMSFPDVRSFFFHWRTIYVKLKSVMDETAFKESLSAFLEGDFDKNDKKVIKERINDLIKEEANLKAQLDKNKRDFLKKRDKLISSVNQVKSDIKSLKSIIKKKQ